MEQQIYLATLEKNRDQFALTIKEVKHGVKTPCQGMAIIYQRMDDALSKAPEKIACDGSCSYCCYYHVYITPIEVFSILEYMDKKLDSKKKEGINERISANLMQIKGMTVDEHIATNVKCAFLSDIGRCDIYNIRPMACRKHHAIYREPCKITFYDTASSVQNHLSPVREAISTVFFALNKLSSSLAKVDSTRYEINAALREAMDNHASLKRWKNGKVAFPTVRDRGTS